jgi:hypothetical protein
MHYVLSHDNACPHSAETFQQLRSEVSEYPPHSPNLPVAFTSVSTSRSSSRFASDSESKQAVHMWLVARQRASLHYLA